jgi:DNA helicase IV
MNTAKTRGLARWVGSAGRVSVGPNGLNLSDISEPWFHQDTISVQWVDGFIWGDLRLKRRDGLEWVATLSKKEGRSISGAIADSTRDAVRRQLSEVTKRHARALGIFKQQLDGRRYLGVSNAKKLFGDEAVAEVASWLRHPMLRPSDVEGLSENPRWWVDYLRDPSVKIAENNRRWIEKEVVRYKPFFDKVGRKGLTDEQRRACVLMADRSLVSAAAGSGKTSTLVGKVGYLLSAGHATKEEILLLAFNRSAAKEIGERIAADLSPMLGGGAIEARTFHGFGLSVIADATGKKPSVFEPGGGKDRFWSDLIDSLATKDPAFASLWWMFRAAFLKQPMDPASFKTVEEWEEFVDTQGERTRDRRNGFLTLNGELVKSQGELAIANWLALHGVAYEYERPYEYETADRDRRQYRPDFYLPDIETYIEHFAIDRNGNPPPAFGQKYADSMEWKRALHARKQTRLIETTFAQFVEGTLFEHLELALRDSGQAFEETPKRELLERLKERQQIAYGAFLNSVLIPFVSHAKNNRIVFDQPQVESRTTGGDLRSIVFSKVMAKLLREYDRLLRARNEVDFDDMILMAGDLVREGRYTSRFKVILVDEFQDISRARSMLVKAVADQSDDTMLMGVGDARQSIYRFAGSDVSIFKHFGTVFGSLVPLSLTKTFRFNQGIADVSATFGGFDDDRVVSDNIEREGVVRVRLYADAKARATSIYSVLKEIADEVSAAGKTSASVLVLYRVNQIGRELGPLPNFGVLTINRMSIHASKGGEADYVVLAGVVETGTGSFPSKIADDPLLQLVMPEKEAGEAEERRLMYVALTRARSAAYIVASMQSQSDFVRELVAMASASPSVDVKTIEGENPSVCPGCSRGYLVLRNGPYGPFLGCTRFPRCGEKRRLNENAESGGEHHGPRLPPQPHGPDTRIR